MTAARSSRSKWDSIRCFVTVLAIPCKRSTRREPTGFLYRKSIVSPLANFTLLAASQVGEARLRVHAILSWMSYLK